MLIIPVKLPKEQSAASQAAWRVLDNSRCLTAQCECGLAGNQRDMRACSAGCSTLLVAISEHAGNLVGWCLLLKPQVFRTSVVAIVIFFALDHFGPNIALPQRGEYLWSQLQMGEATNQTIQLKQYCWSWSSCLLCHAISASLVYARWF